MNGLELSRAYFEEYGKPALEEKFSSCLPYIAVGLFGAGSECFGYDDLISRDHDFEPGFCILLPDEETVDRRTAFLMEREYARLPREFMGIPREILAPVGGTRRGVLRIAEVFKNLVGTPDGELTLEQWLTVPEQGLAEATNGWIFYDAYGEVTRIREKLRAYPEDVRLKRLAGNLLLMAQSGQYNYRRCLNHGESGAAQLAVFAFAESAMTVIFLLNRRYQPFYKWRFRALRSLDRLGELGDTLEYLITSSNDGDMPVTKQRLMDRIIDQVIGILNADGLSASDSADLERHAYFLNDRIHDAGLRNMHILAAV